MTTATVILTTFVFVYPSEHFTIKVKAKDWGAAYGTAVEQCVKAVQKNDKTIDFETVIDICANPKESK